MIKELSSENENQIARTFIDRDGEYLVVSTVILSPEIKALDSMLSIFEGFKELGDRPAKFGTPGTYESMVFNADSDGEVSDWTERDFARYSSEEEAKEGHNHFVEKWSEN